MKKALVCCLLTIVFVVVSAQGVREAIWEGAKGFLPDWEKTPQDGTLEAPSYMQQLGGSVVSEMLTVTLYYRYEQTDLLGMERAQIDLRREETVARSIVEQLVAGPSASHARLRGVFPQGTKVISVATEGSTAFVTLSEEFLGRPDGAPSDWEDSTLWQEEATLRRWLAAQSIVCALTEGGRVQRVQLYVARNDDDAPRRIPLFWFDRNVQDMSVVLAACQRDEAVILTPARAAQRIFDAWQHRDWADVYAFLCERGEAELPTFSVFEARMRDADVSLLNYEVSSGSVDATGQAATLLFGGMIRSADGDDAQLSRESIPMVRAVDNWAMPYDTFLSLMIRE